MKRALIIECDEQQATFSNGDMLQFSDDSINLTDATRVNDMTGYCISLDYYNDNTGDYECYYEFFQTLAGFIYPISWCTYDYDDESHSYYIDECSLDSDAPLAIIKNGNSKDSNLNFWRAMYKAIQAMQK